MKMDPADKPVTLPKLIVTADWQDTPQHPDLYFIYFAYGSNLNPSQMRQRCPSSRFLCRALLQNFTFGFTKYSAFRQGGVMDILPQDDTHIWGVVYRVNEPDMEALDKKEGLFDTPPIYRRTIRPVLREGLPQRVIQAQMYEIIEKAADIPPSESYMRVILEGAQYWQLPQEYIERLAGIKTSY